MFSCAFSSKGTWSYIDGNTCGADGAHLVSIQDPYEYSFIRQWMWQENIQEDLWIGLMSKAVSNHTTYHHSVVNLMSVIPKTYGKISL